MEAKATDRLAVEQCEVFGYERARKAAPAGRSARSINQSATRGGVVFFPEACPPLRPVPFPSTLLGGRSRHGLQRERKAEAKGREGARAQRKHTASRHVPCSKVRVQPRHRSDAPSSGGGTT